MPNYPSPQDFGMVGQMPEIQDHSFSNPLTECERMAYYGSFLGRRVTNKENFAFAWGGTVHALAEIWLKTGNLEQLIETISMNIPEETDDRYGRNQRRMQDLIIEWIKFRKTDPLEIIRVEQPTIIACLDDKCPYGGCNLVYGGRLDNIVRWNALIGPLDLKTTVMDQSDPVSDFKPSHQIGGYVWMTSHLTGMHCWGGIIEQLVCNKSKIKINRFPIPYTKDMVKEWAEQEVKNQARFKYLATEHPNNESEWRQNYNRCSQPYTCDFRDACLSPRDAGFRYRWLRDNTIEHRHDFQRQEETANAE